MFPSLSTRSDARRGQHSIRRNGVPNMMERCGCSTRRVSPTVAHVRCARSVKDMVPPPKSPRRVSAVLHPRLYPVSEEHPPPRLPAAHPILWDDWPRCQPRRAWIQWLRNHLVIVDAQPPLHPPPPLGPFTRAQRAHWRMTLEQRLARNARPPAAPPVEITVYGLPTVFAQTLGLRVA